MLLRQRDLKNRNKQQQQKKQKQKQTLKTQSSVLSTVSLCLILHRENTAFPFCPHLPRFLLAWGLHKRKTQQGHIYNLCVYTSGTFSTVRSEGRQCKNKEKLFNGHFYFQSKPSDKSLLLFNVHYSSSHLLNILFKKKIKSSFWKNCKQTCWPLNTSMKPCLLLAFLQNVYSLLLPPRLNYKNWQGGEKKEWRFKESESK